MFETKSELRKFATITSLITAIALTLTGCAPQLTEEQKVQLNFAQSKFVNGTYVEGFTAGQPDYGITMEMLLQRDGLYDTSESQRAAVAAVLEEPNLSGTVDQPTGYLFGDQGIKIDLTGKYAFTSVAVSAANETTRKALIEAAAVAFEAVPAQTDFAIAWLTLGLSSNKNERAAAVAEALIAGQNADGGFDDFTPGESTSDATGLALLALKSVEGSVDAADAITKAQNYLSATLVEGDHYMSYGAPNVNGTAYAFMGLKATDASEKLIAPLQTWLASQLQADGGVQAGFAPGASDTMATSQALLAINGRTYLDLI